MAFRWGVARGNRRTSIFNMKCQDLTLFGGMWCAPIFKQHQVPTTPLLANQAEEDLMRLLRPLQADQQGDLTGGDIDGPVKDAALPITGNGHLHRLAPATITTIQGWGRGNDDFIQHQDDGARSICQPLFSPPLACRQVEERKAREWRGLFQVISKRARANRTLETDTSSPCSAVRYWARRDAVQTVELKSNSRGAWSMTSSINGSIIPATVTGRPLRGLTLSRTVSSLTGTC